jgi:stage III sporulation protein AG
VQELFKGIEPRRLRLIALGLLVGIGLIVVSGAFGGSPSPSTGGAPSAAAPAGGDPLAAWQARIDQEVARVLSQVAGAGAVTVTVTLAGSPAESLAENETVRTTVSRSNDAGGGGQTATTNETDRQVVLTGQSAPIVLSEVGPRVVGVLVVAAGAGDPVVREELTQAVETLLGVPAYKVMVLPKGGGGR